jgi:hypothetical protein
MGEDTFRFLNQFGRLSVAKEITTAGMLNAMGRPCFNAPNYCYFWPSPTAPMQWRARACSPRRAQAKLRRSLSSGSRSEPGRMAAASSKASAERATRIMRMFIRG